MTLSDTCRQRTLTNFSKKYNYVRTVARNSVSVVVVFLLLNLAVKCSAQDNDVITFNFNGDPEGVLERQRSPSQQQKELLILETLARRKPGQHPQDVDDSIVDLLGRSKEYPS